MVFLPNEVWGIIWCYHYKNIRLLAAKKKKHITDMIKSFDQLYYGNNNQPFWRTRDKTPPFWNEFNKKITWGRISCDGKDWELMWKNNYFNHQKFLKWVCSDKTDSFFIYKMYNRNCTDFRAKYIKKHK